MNINDFTIDVKHPTLANVYKQIPDLMHITSGNLIVYILSIFRNLRLKERQILMIEKKIWLGLHSPTQLKLDLRSKAGK